MKTQWIWAAASVMFAAATFAQPPEQGAVIIRKEVRAAPGTMALEEAMGPVAMGPVTMDFIGAEMSFSNKPVKGAPYAAQAVTETTQTLSDGNRITHKSTASIFRDSEGRTRREEALGAIGPWASGGDAPQTIFISDPVAGVSYHLDPQTRIAHKITMGKDVFYRQVGASAAGGGGAKWFTAVAPPPFGAEGRTGGMVMSGGMSTMMATPAVKMAKPDVKSESLGKQTIEGLQAEGTRSTMTMAAGAIGNERPIETVSERWYSPELQTVVMSKRSDPRFGETVYRLTNVQRGEQSPTLFEVPADYTPRDDMSEKVMTEKLFTEKLKEAAEQKAGKTVEVK
jgi:hypothetical protein